MERGEEKKRNKPRRSGEERGLRAYFVRLFGKYDIRDEKQFITLGKWLIFIVLVIVELLIILQHIYDFSQNGGWGMLLAILIVESSLTLSSVMKFFVVRKGKGRIAFYLFDVVAACAFLFVTNGSYPLLVYMLVLTALYFGADKALPSWALLCIAMPLYAVSYAASAYIGYDGTIQLLPLLTQSLGSVFGILVHFLVVQVALAFYRQYLRLDKTLRELDESKKELEKAYAVVAEVTALEERQRIAKEIHDTAGHSITTVIMQTEAAKLIIGESPEEAKQKIVAANLQAKHALEELRDSVHLLSGTKADQTLKSALEGIIHESTDGTGITIRSEIEDARVSPAKFRFLCNSLKEGVSNGLRHGGATAFWFSFKREGDELCFLLSDNGRGVVTDELRLGFGLTGMQERAKAFGGEIKFQSEADEGFELHLVLPVDTEEKQ
ncbi:MAG: sensor histidine kinase [Clostridia bacterium]|nr:sensor histidine kinase [Clostridia bacterium]